MKNQNQVIQFVKVSPDLNENRYVTLEQKGDVFTRTIGRNGNPTGYSQRMPMSAFDAVKENLVKEGYAERALEAVEHRKYKEIEDPAVREAVSFLLERSRKYVDDSYSVTYETVTQAMVDRAYGILRLMRENAGGDVAFLNGQLIELFGVIPRAMRNVGDFLIGDRASVNRVLAREQEILDAMAAQVRLRVAQQEHPEETILDSLGVSMEKTSGEEEASVIRHLNERDRKRYMQSFLVHNLRTDGAFKAYMAERGMSRRKDVHFRFHGSRNENWFGLLAEGPQIHPDAQVTGKSLGPGIYLADDSQKSGHYMDGGFWAKGESQGIGFMGVYKCAWNNPVHLKDRCVQYDVRTIKPHDAVFMEGGGCFFNNEYCLYDPRQLTIRYLIQMAA